MKRPNEPSEHAEQCVVMQWAALNAAKWPCLHLLYAVPNGAFLGGEVKTLRGGKTVPVGAIRARKLKAEGLKEGVPDLCLPVPSGCATRGLYIEMKRRTQGRPSPMQNWWRACLNLMGYRATLCRGADEAIEVLRQHVAHAPKVTLPPVPMPAPRATAAKRRPPSVKAKKARLLLLPPQNQ